MAHGKWDYALVSVWFVAWDYVRDPRWRRTIKLELDSEADWEKVREKRREGWQLRESDGVWVALDPVDGSLRPQLAVLQNLGREGWEVVGVQTTGVYESEWRTWHSSTFVLKRPLLDSAGE